MIRFVACLLLGFALTFVTGCADHKETARSQVETTVRKDFNDANFPVGGKLEDKDPWQHQLTWSVDKKYSSDVLTVRSNGPDGLPFTRDDIVATRSIARAPEKDDRREKNNQAVSQVESLVRLEFEEKNFPDGGVFAQKDVWGGEVTWLLEKGYFSYKLTVRSNGPDKLPFTPDDVIARRSLPFPDGQGAGERYVRGLTRGWLRGLREGATKPLPPETKK